MRRQTMSEQIEGLTDEEVDEMERGYIDIERQAHLGGADVAPNTAPAKGAAKLPLKERDLQHGRVVDVVLSDMSEPWDQTVGFYKKSLSDPYSRMMNTSGNGFRDHAGSMVRMRVVLRCFAVAGADTGRICAWRRCPSRSIRSRRVAIFCASSTRDPRRRHLRRSSSACLPRCLGRSQTHHAV
jgi:23S rRNA U2552 (ribose-2'-O)-methylase RlmE/FtsJ